jgi:superfamily II DNA helicase RecQ
MQFKICTIPVLEPGQVNEELNKFLRANKIVEGEKHLVQVNNTPCWCFCISYISGTGTFPGTSRSKIDYKTALDEQTFKVFSRLREIRKKIATDDGVSAYVVFTDAELAEIAKLQEMSTNKLKSIKGIGDKKAEKYGKLLIQTYHETDRQPG